MGFLQARRDHIDIDIRENLIAFEFEGGLRLRASADPLSFHFHPFKGVTRKVTDTGFAEPSPFNTPGPVARITRSFSTTLVS